MISSQYYNIDRPETFEVSHESFANVAYCYGKEQIPTSNKEHCSNETVDIIRNIKSSLAS